MQEEQQQQPRRRPKTSWIGASVPMMTTLKPQTLQIVMYGCACGRWMPDDRVYSFTQQYIHKHLGISRTTTYRHLLEAQRLGYIVWNPTTESWIAAPMEYPLDRLRSFAAPITSEDVESSTSHNEDYLNESTETPVTEFSEPASTDIPPLFLRFLQKKFPNTSPDKHWKKYVVRRAQPDPLCGHFAVQYHIFLESLGFQVDLTTKEGYRHATAQP